MIEYVFLLFSWMPPILQIVVYGLIAIFVIWSVLKIIQLVMDIIPFL